MRRVARLVGGVTVGLAVAAVLPAPAWSASWTAYVTSNGPNGVVMPFDVATHAQAPEIPVGSFPQRVAITPDAATAYVTSPGTGGVTPIDVASGIPRADIAVTPPAGQLADIAVTPDGTAAYVTNASSNTVAKIDIATETQVATIPVGFLPFALAITPDGRKAYVANTPAHSVSVIDLATDTVTATIAVGVEPRAIAVGPDGETAYVAVGGSNTIRPIDVATDTAGAPIPVGTNPRGLAITPDGRTAYAANLSDDSVTPIDLATGTPGAAIPAGNGPLPVAVTPDGATLFAGSFNGDSITPIDVTTGTAAPAFHLGTSPYGIAITPDQAPTAVLSAAVGMAGSTTTFDGSASSSPVGTVVRYDWDFGDGETESTTAPVVEHVYADPGDYDVTLTVTNSAGTSMAQVYTGHTVSRQGDPRARTQATVSVAAQPAPPDREPTPTPTPPTAHQPAEPRPVAPTCMRGRLVLSQVRRHGRTVRLAGVADHALAGREVELLAGGAVVARAVVGRDGAFAASAPAPAAKAARTVRYQARIGAERSYSLRLQRHARVLRAAMRDGRVVLSGRIRGAPRRATVELLGRANGCAGFEVVGRARLGRGGRFRITATPFPGAGVGVYRARAKLRGGANTYTLPRAVALR